MYGDIGSVSEINQLRPIFHRLESINQQYPHDGEIQAIIGDVRQRLIARGQTLMEAGGQQMPTGQTAAPRPSADPFASTGGAPAPLPTQVMPSGAPPRVDGGTKVAPAGTAPPTSPAAPAIDLKKTVIIGAAIGLVVFVLFIVGVRLARRRPPEPPPVTNIAFEVRTNPPGASIRVGNEHKCNANCQVQLPPGEHQIQAVLDGYEPAARTVSLAAGSPAAPVDIELQPVAQAVRITTDLDSGKITLDDQPPVDLVDGAFVFDRVAPGKHAVKVTGRGTEAAFAFEVTPAKAPIVEGTPSARGLIAVLVSNFQTDGKLYASAPALKVSLDGQPLGQPGASGLELKNLSSGFRELTLGEGDDAQKKLISIGPTPMLTALILRPTVTAGTLMVVTGEDGVSVFVNGKEQRRKTARGALRIPDLVAGSYKVRVQKDGYEADQEMAAEIKKGVETKVEFKLRPVQRVAALSIRGAAAGATVWLDGTQVGVIGPDGSFSRANIPPGEHTVELRKDGGLRRIQRLFQAGGTIEVSGPEVAMERPPARIRVNANPADARITWRRADEPASQARVAPSSEFTVQEGSYVFSASAPGFTAATQSVVIAAGETKPVDFRLNRERAGTPPSTKPTYGMDYFERPGEWSPEGAWLARRGGNYVMYRATPTYGTFTYSIYLMRGGRLQWVVNYIDDRNHVLFQLDDNGKFTRREIINGRGGAEIDASHGLRKKEFTVEIDITPTSITHKLLYDASTWKPIDTWSGTVPPNAKFGLYIPRNDQYGLANFKFTPR
jgi:hypothetical protein